MLHDATTVNGRIYEFYVRTKIRTIYVSYPRVESIRYMRDNININIGYSGYTRDGVEDFIKASILS